MKKNSSSLQYLVDTLFDDVSDNNFTDVEYDTIYRQQPFPYEVDIILKKKSVKRDQGGGGSLNDSNSILYFLNNLEYNIIETLPIIKKNCETYKFEVDKQLNIKNNYNSHYISNGYYSTVVGIKLITEKENETRQCIENIPEKLVLKCKFIKKNTERKIRKQRKDFYMIYRRRKNNNSKLGKSLPDCYFCGSNIQKEKYIPDITNESCDKPEEYDKLFEDSLLEFSIWKYYSLEISSIRDKKYVLLKLSVYLYYINKKGLLINDLKFSNIVFDKNNDYNIINIDYDWFLCVLYKIPNNKYVLWDFYTLAYYFSNDIKKRLYLLLKPNTEETKNKIAQLMCDNNRIYSDDPKDNDMQKYRYAVLKILYDITNAELYYHKNMKPRYLTDTDLHFERFNIIAIVDTILSIFFKKINMNTLIFNDLSELIHLNPIVFDNDASIVPDISSFHNTNDVKILTFLIHEYIKANDDMKEDEDYINALKNLIFDPITETGLLGTDFECIPSYEMVAAIFKKLNKDDTLIQDQFKKMIDDNIGTNKVLRTDASDYLKDLTKEFIPPNIGKDVIEIFIDLEMFHRKFDEYETWKLLLLTERLMDRPENRSDTSLDLPSENSTLPQNYILTTDNTTYEEKKTIKWVKNEKGIYVESPEYISIKNQIETGQCIIKLSNRQVKFDKSELRKFAMGIVKFLKEPEPDLDISGLSQTLSNKITLLKSLDRRKYLELETKQKPIIWKSPTIERRLKKERMEREAMRELAFEEYWRKRKEKQEMKSETIKDELPKLQPEDTKSQMKESHEKPWPRAQGIDFKDKGFRDKYLKYKIKYLKLKNEKNT